APGEAHERIIPLVSNVGAFDAGAGDVWVLAQAPDGFSFFTSDFPITLATTANFSLRMYAMMAPIHPGPIVVHHLAYVFQRDIAEHILPALVPLAGDAEELRQILLARVATPECTNLPDEEVPFARAMLTTMLPMLEWGLGTRDDGVARQDL